MSKNLAITIGYLVSAVVVFGGYKAFGWKWLLIIIPALFVEQVYYRIKHGHWQKSTYSE